jgi:hypothetical protein
MASRNALIAQPIERIQTLEARLAQVVIEINPSDQTQGASENNIFNK